MPRAGGDEGDDPRQKLRAYLQSQAVIPRALEKRILGKHVHTPRGSFFPIDEQALFTVRGLTYRNDFHREEVRSGAQEDDAEDRGGDDEGALAGAYLPSQHGPARRGDKKVSRAPAHRWHLREARALPDCTSRRTATPVGSGRGFPETHFSGGMRHL